MDTANVGYSYHLPSGGWNYKIRNTLSQFSDLFSEFNKYIAPAYHHDRCERSVPMRIYSMHKGEFVMVFIGFLALFGLGIFIGLAGPSPTKTTSMSASNVLTNTSSIYQGPFHLHSPALGTQAQQLWLFAEILTNNDDEEIFDKAFEISFSIEGVLADHSTTELMTENDAPNRTQHLRCKSCVCEEVQVMHIGVLEYTHYVLNVNFYGLSEFHKRYYIREIMFYFKTYNPAFTQLELWFRFIFVITSFSVTKVKGVLYSAVTHTRSRRSTRQMSSSYTEHHQESGVVSKGWFFYSLRRYHVLDWAIEQKWISALLTALVMANDPIYPLRLFPQNYLATFIGDTTMLIFLSLVLMSWLVQYHGLRQNDRSYTTFYLIKWIIVGMVVGPAITMTYWQKYVSVYDSTYNYRMNPSYPMVKTCFFCAITLYYLYLLFLIIRAYSDLRSMPYFDIRLRCLSVVVGTVSFVITVLALQGWGPAALQDHWASQPQTHYDTSAPFMALIGLFNFKLYILAYMFTPGNAPETTITKDNPAFSMINDSDEEVIYGSDEESRRPLNSHHRITEEDI